jgi:hypothetical protein
MALRNASVGANLHISSLVALPLLLLMIPVCLELCNVVTPLPLAAEYHPEVMSLEQECNAL